MERNAPVSSEITGYAVSAFLYLHSLTGDDRYRKAGLRSAHFLVDQGWDRASMTFPFEPGSDRAYFFDIGIIIRGLLAAARATGDSIFKELAKTAALSLAFDFLGENEFAPVISLPQKQAPPYEPRWSRMPGCYQLKSAVAWKEVGEEHGDRMFHVALGSALATHESFLPGEEDRERVMDRLHAYGYFLEALLWVADRPEARKALEYGIEKAAGLFRDIAPQFERSDVSAQLLRVRLIAHHLHGMPLDERAACHEASRCASFQIVSESQVLNGGFWFGSKAGAILPFANPVSTAFAMQALQLWEDHNAGNWRFQLHQLI